MSYSTLIRRIIWQTVRNYTLISILSFYPTIVKTIQSLIQHDDTIRCLIISFLILCLYKIINKNTSEQLKRCNILLVYLSNFKYFGLELLPKY